MFRNYSGVGVGLLAVLIAADACADDATMSEAAQIQKTSIFSLSAFGTLGAAQTNTDNGTYTTALQKHGATKTADFGPDTKAGGQLDAKFNDDFSATLQLFSKQDAAGSYHPDIEWAFAKLKMGGGFDLRLGRIGAPIFMTSDFRNVGYTNVSVRTPSDVYGLVPIRSFDGGDILYETTIGNTNLNGQLWLGKASILTGENAGGDENILLNNIAGINFSAENGPLTLRFGRLKTRLGTSGGGLTGFNTLTSSLTALSAAPGLGSLATISDDLTIDNKFATFTSLGAIVDNGNWILSGELVKRETASTYVPTITAWYTTLGYRVAKLTPYVSFSGHNVNSVTSVTSPLVSPLLPPIIQGTVPVLIGAANSLLVSSKENTASLGVRWDVGKNYDVKAEIQQVRVPAGSSGLFINVQGGSYGVNTNVSVFSLCVDFVF